MPSSDNRVIVACAGSGKTSRLVTEALVNRGRRIAMVTYTINNAREIDNRFGERNSGVPAHVDVMTWFGFLLQECARPYQRAKYAEKRIESILFANQQSAQYVQESDVGRYYFANGELIYSDKIAQFVLECEKKSSKSVTRRLAKVYTDVFIDEFQDLAGWDLDVVEMLLQSDMHITLVGDPRQHIYSTNPSLKNKQYRGADLVKLVEKWERKGLCSLEHMNRTYRCNRAVCDFSNALWPGMGPMMSLRHDTTEHDGVFLVAEDHVSRYVQRYRAQILRYHKNANSYGYDAMNFGLAKGLEFDRVLIVPTTPIKRYLQTGKLDYVEKTREKLHVAVTRARHSVAFVLDKPSPVVPNRWNP